MPSQQVPQIQVDPLDLEHIDDEDHVQLALAAIARNGFKDNGRLWLSLREAATAFNVSRTKLTERFKGHKTKKEAHKHEKSLTYAEETALKDWVKEMGHRGIPLHASAVAQHATVISGKTIGERWAGRFCAHHPDLKMRWTSGLEKCRAQSLNKVAVGGFYDMLEELQEVNDIPDENIYNMDEKGIQLGMGK